MPKGVGVRVPLPVQWPVSSMDRIFDYGSDDGRSNRSQATNAPMVKLVDAQDLKFCFFGSAGSIPARSTLFR